MSICLLDGRNLGVRQCNLLVRSLLAGVSSYLQLFLTAPQKAAGGRREGKDRQ